MFIVRFLFIFSLFLSSLVASIIEVDENTNALEILPSSYIYIDNTKKLSLEEVKKKEFKENKETFLAYGYGPPFAVWVKFTLKNTTNNTITKILQYDHEITTDIIFFNGDKIYKEGILGKLKPRDTINPTFDVQLKEKETKTYYLKASSYITPLTIKLNLWKIKSFYKNEINHQFMLALFFGAMGILALYNLFIYFSTKDISYFWYVLYICGAIVHHLFYSGIIYKYETNEIIDFLSTRGAYIVVTFQFIALGLFTKYFLDTKRYSKINKILSFYIITIIILVVYGIYIEYTSGLQIICYILFILYLFFIACYLSFKKNRQAYFLLAGWLLLFSIWILLAVINYGLFGQSFESFYLIEIGILGEALIFSFALADRIKTANKEKEIASQKLIDQQKSEEKRLQIEVKNKTKDLSKALEVKETLFKELHHRVKNNMQMVVSMLRLQSDDVKDENIKQAFSEAQNRISTMAHLHELLYKQDDITHINTYHYFSLLIDQLTESSPKNIEIKYDINANLKMEQAIYCGLILNELVSNSIKYAFEKDGKIEISLLKDVNSYVLKVSDNGKGFDKTKKSDSLGLILINSLVKKQLKGIIDFNTSSGTEVTIYWNNNAKN